MVKGRLRLYLGAAPGVGKTFAMLNEGRRRSERGTDVVVGYVETHGREHTQAALAGLEVVPRRVFEHRDTTLEEMDIDAVLARRPAVVLVDELAHTNAPGSRHEKRWQDVHELLDAGIDVISTVNIQHLESVNDVVEQITGVRQRETVPDAVARAADQVELVDMTPEALRRRMAHGNIYSAERVDAALANYFRPGNLAALRELALLWLADKVEESLQQYMQSHGITAPWETRERVVVALTGAPSGEHLIRRAARMARRAQGDLIGVHVSTGQGLVTGGTDNLARHRELLADLDGEYHEVVGNDIATSLVRFARSEKATQLVVGTSAGSRTRLISASVLERIIREAGDLDVHVISDPGGREDRGPRSPVGPASGRLRRRSTRASLTPRRVAAGWAVILIGLPLLTVLLHLAGTHLGLTSDLLLYLLVVTAAAAIGGTWPGIAGAILASLLVNWFFTEPKNTFTIAELENALAVAIFVAVAMTVSQLVSRLTAREIDALRASAEAEALARVAGGMAGNESLASIALHLRSTFGLDRVTISTREFDGTWVEAARSAVDGADQHPSGVDVQTARLPIGTDADLELHGPALSADDQRVLRAFTAQLAGALERERLERGAAEAAARTQGDALRTAILRAVSHDLRTPLASIKASVTSLRQGDVEWSDDARAEFLAVIEEETDRLNRLVGNLLDMSRIEAGAVDATITAVGAADVIASALTTVPDSGGVEIVGVDDGPQLLADRALLERVLANLISNAQRFAPPDQPVRVSVGTVGNRTHVRVIDRGPGVAEEERAGLTLPFRRLGDGGSASGVGLGLAVAQGFVTAMGGRLELEDTPGGGLTAVVELPSVDDAGLPDHAEPILGGPDR